MINLDQQFSNILEKYNKIENSLNSMANMTPRWQEMVSNKYFGFRYGW